MHHDHHHATSPPTTTGPAVGDAPRRNFLKEALALVIGAIVGLAPLVVGLIPFFDPLRKRDERRIDAGGASASGDGESGTWIKVTQVSNLNDAPQRFKLITDRVDAWTVYRQEPVGAVYLWMSPGASKPVAITTICPHLGCMVDYDSADNGCFKCPCHTSKFALDGEKLAGPSPRPLDYLEVDVRGDEVWVRFQKFKCGVPEREVEA